MKKKVKIAKEYNSIMIALIRPILFSFVTSRRVKQLIVDLLQALASKTENSLDDIAVKAVRDALLPEEQEWSNH